MPKEVQRKVFGQMLARNGITLRNTPVTDDPDLTEPIVALAQGIFGSIFPGNEWLIGQLGNLVVGGSRILRDLMRADPPPIPNMPPVITCPPSIERYQEPGKKYASVSWQEPTAYDVEDGQITRFHRSGDKKPGDKFFSGETIIGYRVRDSEGRTDECSFYVTVNLIKCENIPLSHQLVTNCTTYTLLGETCVFSCLEGYRLAGADSLTCTKSKTYDNDSPTCEIRTCPEPPMPQGGKKWDCSDNYNYDSTCVIECDIGFRIDDNLRAPWNIASTKCQASENWTVMPICKDISAPTITNCPLSKNKYAERGKNSTTVTWPDIIGSDTNGGSTNVTRIKGPPSGSIFEEGAHEIVYEAMDDVGLKDTCAFYINIEVRSCPVPHFSHEKLDITCNSQFTHGSACTVGCKQGITLEGANRITCEVVGGNMTWSTPGGMPTCLEKKCPVLKHPPNAMLECSEFAGGKICYVKCNRNHIPGRNAMQFPASTCSPATGIWRNAPHPGCVKKRTPASLKSNLLFYWKAPCARRDTKNVTATFVDILSQNYFMSVCPGCQVERVRSSCRKRPAYKMMAVRWSVVLHLKEGDDIEYIGNTLQGVGIRMKNWLRRNFTGLPVIGAGGENRFKGSANTVNCIKKYKAYNEKTTCAACAPGYEFDGDVGCHLCPNGTYQDDSGDAWCIPCPRGRETTGPGKTREMDCKAPCWKGSYSRTGLTPCRDCPIGQYQMKERSTRCDTCPDGQLTPAVGSDKKSECYAPASLVKRFRVKSRGPTHIELKWWKPEAPNGKLLGYEINYLESPENISSEVTVQVNNTQDAMISPLVPSTEYEFTVCAVTEKGKGLERSLKATTLNATEITTTTSAPTTIDPTLCPPGTNSYGGRQSENETCIPCDKDFYQDLAGQDSCEPCPAGFSTWYEGSLSCVNSTWTTPTITTTTPSTTTAAAVPCPPGHVSNTGFVPGCRKCPKNKVSNMKRKRCKWCPKDDNKKFVCVPKKTAKKGTKKTSKAKDKDGANRTNTIILKRIPE